MWIWEWKILRKPYIKNSGFLKRHLQISTIHHNVRISISRRLRFLNIHNAKMSIQLTYWSEPSRYLHFHYKLLHIYVYKKKKKKRTLSTKRCNEMPLRAVEYDSFAIDVIVIMWISVIGKMRIVHSQLFLLLLELRLNRIPKIEFQHLEWKNEFSNSLQIFRWYIIQKIFSITFELIEIENKKSWLL